VSEVKRIVIVILLVAVLMGCGREVVYIQPPLISPAPPPIVPGDREEEWRGITASSSCYVMVRYVFRSGTIVWAEYGFRPSSLVLYREGVFDRYFTRREGDWFWWQGISYRVFVPFPLPSGSMIPLLDREGEVIFLSAWLRPCGLSGFPYAEWEPIPPTRGTTRVFIPPVIRWERVR
jgi:hypothetical protein